MSDSIKLIGYVNSKIFEKLVVSKRDKCYKVSNGAMDKHRKPLVQDVSKKELLGLFDSLGKDLLEEL